jgi:hypothetical protein
MKTRCPFRDFRDLFGKPGQGVHQYKFKGTSIVDYMIVIGVAFLVTYVTDIPLVLTTIGILLLGIVAHMLVGLPTQSIKFLGLTCK